MAKQTGKKRLQETIITCLLQSDTIAEAAANAGIGESTIYLYLKDEEFNQAYRDAKKECLNLTIKNIAANSNAAFQEMHHLMLNAKSENVRLNAAAKLIDFSFKGYEVIELESEIEQIRKELNEYAEMQTG